MDTLRNTKNAICVAWTRLAEWGVQGLMLVTLAGVVLALTDWVQSRPFAIIGLIAVLAALVWVLFDLLDTHKDIRPAVYDESVARKRRAQAFAFVVCVPIALSWLKNETPYGAINPVGYWLSESEVNTHATCTIERDILARAAEKLQVLQNQQRVGLATSYDVLDQASGLKLIADMYNSCMSNKAKRRADIQRRLEELKPV